MGGAQAVAALAIGTASIARVDVVAGPGNALGHRGKAPALRNGRHRRARRARPSWSWSPTRQPTLARSRSTLLAQAEHGPDSPIVVMSAAGALSTQSHRASKRSPPSGPPSPRRRSRSSRRPSVEPRAQPRRRLRPRAPRAPLRRRSRRAADRRASPAASSSARRARPRSATTPPGSNHVLPTGGAARFSGPLGVGAFRRRMSVVEVSAGHAAKLAPAIDEIAKAEGLPVHGESAMAEWSKKTAICR